MTLGDEIRLWLDQKGPYKDGLLLYARCPHYHAGTNKLLSAYEDRHQRQKLEYELGKAAAKNPVRIPENPKAPEPVTESKATTEIPLEFLYRKEYLTFPDEAPEPVIKWVKKCKQHYRQADDFHSRMREDIGVDKRYEYAKLVLYHRKQVDVCWVEIKKYTNDGTVPSFFEEAATFSAAQAMKKLVGSVRPKITRYKSKLKATPDNAELASMLEEQEALAAHLKQIIEDENI
jgi:hypothetical protein